MVITRAVVISSVNTIMAGQNVVIRNSHSGLVLDASEYQIKLQHFTGFASQLWTMEPAGPGKHFIVNKSNGKVMDIQGGARKGANLITYQRHGGVNQQWFINSDKSIVSASGNLALDICEGKYSAGTRIIAFPKHGGANQQFYLQYQ